eukprot:CAMPEP_0194173594 /NCGR_PEP_ID=MMETSP0154-20130528/7875_1 /TAXON_ID=1049557 /ORGANISM="Thalassiothrix antarctica, Strain L6-D1" /LENGTH=631 /DNA_ID=CAMNT_0038886693 /DNA_START=106 /DNA_END=1998 /DNA_ORIENTATION=+
MKSLIQTTDDSSSSCMMIIGLYTHAFLIQKKNEKKDEDNNPIIITELLPPITTTTGGNNNNEKLSKEREDKNNKKLSKKDNTTISQEESTTNKKKDDIITTTTKSLSDNNGNEMNNNTMDVDEKKESEKNTKSSDKNDDDKKNMDVDKKEDEKTTKSSDNDDKKKKIDDDTSQDDKTTTKEKVEDTTTTDMDVVAAAVDEKKDNALNPQNENNNITTDTTAAVPMDVDNDNNGKNQEEKGNNNKAAADNNNQIEKGDYDITKNSNRKEQNLNEIQSVAIISSSTDENWCVVSRYNKVMSIYRNGELYSYRSVSKRISSLKIRLSSNNNMPSMILAADMVGDVTAYPLLKIPSNDSSKDDDKKDENNTSTSDTTTTTTTTTTNNNNNFNRFFYATTGAEAVENAIKVSKAFTKRPGIIVFQGGYHGRTALTMAMTSSSTTYKQGFMTSNPPNIYTLPFPYDVKEIESCLAAVNLCFQQQVVPDEIACMIIEPVLGEGGYLPTPHEFLHGLSMICKEHGILFIIDEVQTGFGRTGKYFATEHFLPDIQPDILILAKGLASGFPLSAVVTSDRISDNQKPGTMGGTYAGNAVSCAAAIATQHVLEDEDLISNSLQQGLLLKNGLLALQQQYPDW